MSVFGELGSVNEKQGGGEKMVESDLRETPSVTWTWTETSNVTAGSDCSYRLPGSAKVPTLSLMDKFRYLARIKSEAAKN